MVVVRNDGTPFVATENSVAVLPQGGLIDATPYNLGDRMWDDNNNDGIQNDDEFHEIRVSVTDSGGPVTITWTFDLLKDFSSTLLTVLPGIRRARVGSKACLR